MSSLAAYLAAAPVHLQTDMALDEIEDQSYVRVARCPSAALYRIGRLYILVATPTLATTSETMGRSWARLVEEAGPRNQLRQQTTARTQKLHLDPNDLERQARTVIASCPGSLGRDGSGALMATLAGGRTVLACDGRVISVPVAKRRLWADWITAS